MKRVLVTGASGFVGQQAISPLVALGYEIHAATSTPRSPVDGLVWHETNLLCAGQSELLVRKVRPSHLLHLAWYAEPGRFWHAPDNLAWLAASLDLLRAFYDAGGRRVVMVGTCAEYDWAHGYCTERITPRLPSTLYGVCKNALGDALEAYSRNGAHSSAWARLFFLYGPGEHPARLVPSVIRAMLDSRIAECTHGRQVRDFLHVTDVARALCALLDSPVEGPVNISSGEPVALSELVFRIAENFGRTDLVRLGAIAPAALDPPLLVGNCTRLREEVGWTPRTGLAEGISDAIAWWSARTS